MNDIYAYFDYHGTLKERVSAPIRANSTQVNSIYAYWDNQSVEPVTYSVTWRLVGSDSFETTSEHYAETLPIPANYLRRRDLVFFKEAKLYNFIRFPVPSAVTAVAGTYVATIRYALSTQTTFVLGSLTFDVEGDQGIVLGESLTLDQYNYLLEQYSEVYDWATLRFLPLTGGTISGDLEVTGTTTLDYLNVSEIGAGSISSSGAIRTSDKVAAQEYWLSSPDQNIIKLDASVGDLGELQFGIPSGDYSPAFYGSLGVKMWDGREKVYPTVRFNYYDENDSYESTTEEQIATQDWSDARYLKLTGGTITGHTIFNSSATFNNPVTIYSPLTVQANMTFDGFEGHSGNEWHSGEATFTKNITISAAAPIQAYHAVRKDYVDNLIASVKANAFQVVQTLPQSGEEGIIYLVPVQDTNYYTQYIWEGNDWLDIGDTDIDLSGYLPLSGGSITGNLSISGNLTIDGKDLQTEIAKKITKGAGVFDNTLGSGYSDVAKSLQTSVGRADETPFAFQTTGGSADVETGIQQLRKLVGESVVRNQLLHNGDFSGGTTDWLTESASGTLSVSNGIATWTRTGGTGAFLILYQAAAKFETNTNHKYLVAFRAKASANGIKIRLATSDPYLDFTLSTSWQTYLAVITPRSNIRYFCLNNVTGGPEVGDSIDFDFVNCKSLTQRYGNNTVVNAIIGNDSSTQVKKLLQFDPSILKQTAYDAGTLSSSQSAKLKSVGRNAFDGELEVGWINSSGGEDSSTNTFRSKHYTRVASGQTYILSSALTGYTNMYVYEYDINKNLIKYSGSLAPTYIPSYELTLQPNTCYLRFAYYKNGADFTNNLPSTEVNQICLYPKWDSSRTGYEPYESQTYDLPNIVQRGILKVDASGNVYADGDVAYPDGTGETNYTLIDLGDLNYGTPDANGWTRSASETPLVNPEMPSSTLVEANCASTKWPRANAEIVYANDGYIGIENHGRVAIRDPMFIGKTAAEVKALVSGIKFIYELATPTPITSDPFPENVWADDFGTMQFLDSDGNEIVGLQGADFFYEANIAGFAESVYVKTDGDPEKIVYEDEVYAKAQADARFALKEALGGTLRQVLAVKANIEFSNTAWVDLGDCSFTADSNRTGVFYSSTIYGSLKPQGKLLCTKYTERAGYVPSPSDIANYDDLISSYESYASGWFYIVDHAFDGKTAAEVKEALKGVLLAYEKES